MYLFVVALHVVLCLFMILIILLQPAKGEVGLAFGGGGGSSSVFGPRGPASILQRATTVVAVMFMGTSITLALYSNQAMMASGDVDSELDEIVIGDKSPVPEVAPVPEAPKGDPSAPE